MWASSGVVKRLIFDAFKSYTHFEASMIEASSVAGCEIWAFIMPKKWRAHGRNENKWYSLIDLTKRNFLKRENEAKKMNGLKGWAGELWTQRSEKKALTSSKCNSAFIGFTKFSRSSQRDMVQLWILKKPKKAFQMRRKNHVSRFSSFVTFSVHSWTVSKLSSFPALSLQSYHLFQNHVFHAKKTTQD